MSQHVELMDLARMSELPVNQEQMNLNHQSKEALRHLNREKMNSPGSNDATYRSSLGLLPVNVLANVSNINARNSFAHKDISADYLRKYLENEESISILREASRDSTFKIPPPRPLRLIDHPEISSLGPNNDSRQSEAHLPSMYLLPIGKEAKGCNDSGTPGSPSIGWVDERVASFVAKNMSQQNESCASTREVDWSNLFQKLAVNQDISKNMAEAEQIEKNKKPFENDTKLLEQGEMDNQSFSAEALSISLANRPRSTSFGGNRSDERNPELINTRNERFSDFTNPPASYFGPMGANDSVVGRKLNEVSYLEDSIFTQKHLAAKMNTYEGEKISLGGFPAPYNDNEAFSNSFTVTNNYEFINQAELEFQKEHVFDQFNTPIGKDQCQSRKSKENCPPNIRISTSENAEQDTKDIEDKLSASAYFAMSTSRLGSLEKMQRTYENKSFLSNAPTETNVADIDRPNLGFPCILSPKRKPVSVVSSDHEPNRKSFPGEIPNQNESKLSASNNSNACTNFSALVNPSQNQRSQSRCSDNDNTSTFKKPFAPKVNLRSENQNMQKSHRNTPRTRHSSPIKHDLETPKENKTSSLKSNDNFNNQLNFKSSLSIETLANKNLHCYTTPQINNAPNSITNEFPLAVDKTCLSWLAVGSDKTEEKVATLQNLTNQAIDIRLIIRECAEFTFKKDALIKNIPNMLNNQQQTSAKTPPINDLFAIDAVLQANETKGVIVQFTPTTNCGFGQKRGKLVIKPRGQTGGKQMKASIPLFAHVGMPKIVFDDSFGAMTGNLSNHITTFMGTLSGHIETTKETHIYNRGDVPAFVRLQAFADVDCRILSGEPTDPIRIEPRAFVLDPGCNETIRIYVRPCNGFMEGQHVVAGSLMIFSGPEICRQSLIALKSTSHGTTRSDKHFFGHGVDFNLPFKGENDAQNTQGKFRGQLTGDEESEFQTKMTVTTVKVVGFKSKTPFVRLQVEETLSESRINCTVLDGSPFGSSVANASLLPAVQNYDAITEEEEVNMPPTQVQGKANIQKHCKVASATSPNVASNKMSPNKKSFKADLTIKNSKLFFPPVKIGKTGVEKVVVENRSENMISVSIQSISHPFKTNTIQFEVKPKSFLKLPIIYAPESIGKQRGKLFLKSDCGRIHEVSLIGDSLK